jgi:fructokinase
MLIGGIEGGGTKFICAVYDDKLKEIVCKKRVETTNPEDTIKEILRWFEWVNAEKGKMDSIGLGIFGPLDIDSNSSSLGMIKTSPKMEWNGVNLPKILFDKFQLPVGFNTDVNSAAIGEGSLDIFSNIDRLVYITIGTGIGVAVINKGETLFDNTHSEFGHMILPRIPGDNFKGACWYHKNCWEGLCSGVAIFKRTGKDANMIDKEDIVWEIVAEYVSKAIYNLSLSFCPQKIIIGGSVKNMGLAGEDFFFNLINKKIREHCEKYKNFYTYHDEVIPPIYKDSSGVYGAFIMGKDAYMNKLNFGVITKIGRL